MADDSNIIDLDELPGSTRVFRINRKVSGHVGFRTRCAIVRAGIGGNPRVKSVWAFQPTATGLLHALYWNGKRFFGIVTEVYSLDDDDCLPFADEMTLSAFRRSLS
jgi:hypothetical protein